MGETIRVLVLSSSSHLDVVIPHFVVSSAVNKQYLFIFTALLI